ncbi:hypothetical protein ACE3MQ_14115 [Paenibacillus lentus]|uniref:hypothetical protein n=1 Tax=Paenibacillus lentus TaxID=1338368 RepID=UPI00365D1795
MNFEEVFQQIHPALPDVLNTGTLCEKILKMIGDSLIGDEETLQDKLELFHLVFAEEFDSIFSANIIGCEN